MINVENVKSGVADLADDVEQIVNSYYRLTIVRAVDKGSKLGSSAIVMIFVMALLFFALFFAGFGLSFWIGELLGSRMLGFFIVSGSLFVVLGVVLALNRKVIQPLLRNIIIKMIYD